MRHLPILLLLSIAATIPAPAAFGQAPMAPAAAAPAKTPEVWAGAVQLPGGGELEISLSITRGAEPSATIDIPAQGAFGVPLEIVSLDGDSYTLRIPPPANAELAGTINDQGELAGLLKQAGMEFPFKLERTTAEAAGPPRPQMPKPPFPYAVEDVEFENEPAGITLAGTLTVPEGEGPFPAAVLITGSGPQDRDESLAGHKPFLVIADHLTRAGVAVLRYDDRGFGESEGDHASATTDDFVADALAGVRFVSNDPRIDPARVGVVGHSEGGLAAAMAGAQDSSVDFVVMLAGTGTDGGEVIRSQQVAMMKAAGTPPSIIEEVERGMTGVTGAIRAGADPAVVRPHLRRVLAAQNQGATDEQIDQIVDQQLGFFTSAWVVRFVAIEPAEAISKLTQPTLALFGELDLQVLEDVNVEPVRAALEKAPTDDYTVLVLPDLNHLFQTAETGLVFEYAQIEETMSPKALDILESWITQRFGS